MSKKTIYTCDICNKTLNYNETNKFKRSTYDLRDWPDCWTTKRFDICHYCLNVMRELMKQKKEVK